jgi:hypothetical protein
MSTTQELSIIENFSRYGITADGNVWRVDPPKRGRNAGVRFRVTPVIHPKGHQWYVQLTDDSGKRHRIALRKLQQQVFGGEIA